MKKTHLMVFGKGGKDKYLNINIIIEGINLEVVKQTKFLGIVLDNGLNWRPHITYISQKLS
jgi:hypothetical protein